MHCIYSVCISYFRPPKGAKPEEQRKWTDKEKQLLIQGIEKHGIGHFGEISKELLPKWVRNDFMIKKIMKFMYIVNK